jgi:glutathione S-transferase
MNEHIAILDSAAATLLIVAFYFFTAFRVGMLRGKYGIQAPACSGHPAFDRAYRVQLNTLEQMAIVLPLLWVATIFPTGPAWLPALIGLIWVAGRIFHSQSYMADPEKRVAGAMIGGLINLTLLVLGIAGLIRGSTAL